MKIVTTNPTKLSDEKAVVRTICFLLVPDFSLLAFTMALEPLRAANEITKRELYRWVVVSTDGEPVTSSNGLQISPQAKAEEVGPCWAAVVCGGRNSHLHDDNRVDAWLRRQRREGAKVGAISDGTYLLARAGLLEGHSCTIHWNCIDGFAETYPDIDVVDRIYMIDGNRFTCSGGTASMDLMLKLIEQEHGRELSMSIAEHFMHFEFREPQTNQRLSACARHELGNDKLVKTLELMESNLEEPLAISEIADIVEVSARQIERLFSTYFSTTPSRYYLKLRLRRARHLLTSSSLSVTEIGIACGFASMSHFAKCYRATFGVSPRRERIVAVA